MNDDQVRRGWDEAAGSWARMVRAGYDTYRLLYNNPAFFEFVGDLEGQLVLDAGCGEGYNTRLFAQAGARMVGVDLAPQMIGEARAEEEREPLGIRYEVASVSDLRMFSDASFDAVVSTMALMDCDDYEGAVREFSRVLRPGGLLAFNICHPCFIFSDSQWEYDQQGRVLGLRIPPYFDRKPQGISWRFGAAPPEEPGEPFNVVYFYRTLCEYLNPLCENGFRLERVLEPRPSEEACQSDPRLRKHQLIPQTLCIRARRHAT